MNKAPDSFSLKSVLPAIAIIAGCAGAQKAGETTPTKINSEAQTSTRHFHGCPEGSRIKQGSPDNRFPDHIRAACLENCAADLDDLRSKCGTKILKVNEGKWVCGGNEDKCY